MSYSVSCRVPLLAALLALAAFCLAPATGHGLTLLPGESALWRFQDPGPLSPPYDWLYFHLVDIDFGLDIPTEADIEFYDDQPTGQPRDFLFGFVNFTGVHSWTMGLSGIPQLMDDEIFFILLSNGGGHPFSLPDIQVGEFFRDGQSDIVRAAPIAVTPVPEPAAWSLLALGLVGFAGWARRKRQA